MARPRKDTIDFFPHYVSHGKTMFALENEFGNDGYAAWFKILELLGRSPGHFYEIKTKADHLYLAALLRVSGEKTQVILDFLSELGAIDAELLKNGVIWSDNFVENLKTVYSKRNSNIPDKPHFRTENPSFDADNAGKSGLPGDTEPETPQRKVKESRVEEEKNTSKDTSEAFPSSINHSQLDTEAVRVAEHLAGAILKRDPGYRYLVNGKCEKTVTQWASDIEKIHRLDGRAWEQIWDVTRWCVADDFWSKNILSGATLRKQFDKLVAQMAPKGYASAVGGELDSSYGTGKVLQ